MIFARLAPHTILALALSIPALAGTEPIVTTDLLRVRQVSSIDVSTDGTRAVFSLRSIAAEESADAERTTYAIRSHLFVVSLRDPAATPRQLTFGARGDGSPVLSPDGDQVAFVRQGEGENDASQIWILPLDGGEARQVTGLEHGAFSPVWSPDGRTLLFSSSLPHDEIPGAPPWPMERPQRNWADATDEDETARPDGTKQQIRAWLARNASEQDPAVINRIAFQGEHTLRNEMRYTHLFTLALDDSDAKPIQITSGFHSHGDARFMTDGLSVVYVSQRGRDIHPDRLQASSVWSIDIDGENDHELLALDGWSLGSPRPGGDGTVLAFVASQMDQPADRQSQLALASVVDDEVDPVWLTDDERFGNSVRGFRWSGTGLQLLFTGARHGGVPLMRAGEGLDAPAPVVEENDLGPVGVGAFDVAAQTIVYAQTSPSNPSTLRINDLRGDRELFDPNPWIADKKLSMPEVHWLTRPDGVKVQYWVMQPTNLDSGQTYPVCLEIHGGPSAMWGPGEFSMWHEFQLLCSWGYGVVYSNPRGSGGYGYTHQRANFQDWGDGPTGDVLACLDEALDANDWADPQRLVVTGGSYAGYLTAYIVGHDHRFKAAVAQRGVYDLETFFGEGNAWRLAKFAMGGYPWEARMRQIYRRESPFSDVHKIRTPLLIMHASQDLRTGVSGSEMLYRALKELDRPVEYIRYPGAGHDLSRTGDPHQRLDRVNRIIEFFDRHVENPRPAPQESSDARR